MKICIIGDTHFRLQLPYADAFADGRRGEWGAVKAKIHETAESCDAVVLLGDIFNSKNNPSIVIKEFVEFLNGFGDKEIHMIAGNHCRSGINTALDFLAKVGKSNWHVYSSPSRGTVAGIPSFFIPYMTPALLGVETKEEGIVALAALFPSETLPLCFAHHGFSGTKIRGTLVDEFNEIVLPKDEIEKHFGHTFAGHIHAKQQLSPQITMCGSVFTQEVGEHEKSVWMYDHFSSGEATTEIPLPVRGIYKATYEKWKETPIPEHSIVKCFVTDRATDLEEVKEVLSHYDAAMIVEAYDNEREKTRFDENAVLDLSVDNLLKMLAEAKGISYSDLCEGLELLKL
jgi:DNA repair exonuclease SbcCD nuclease subunit